MQSVAIFNFIPNFHAVQTSKLQPQNLFSVGDAYNKGIWNLHKTSVFQMVAGELIYNRPSRLAS